MIRKKDIVKRPILLILCAITFSILTAVHTPAKE